MMLRIPKRDIRSPSGGPAAHSKGENRYPLADREQQPPAAISGDLDETFRAHAATDAHGDDARRSA
jgi:hypothetical protein